MIFPVISLWPPHGPDCCYVYVGTLQSPWPNWEVGKPYLPRFTYGQQRHSESQSFV